MFNRNILRIAFLTAIVAVFVSATSHANPPLTMTNNLTFDRTVALPGVTLPAGTYVFERGVNSNANIVRVMTRNYERLMFVGFTTRVVRPRGLESAVSFGEAPAGEAILIAAWYPIGSNQGHQFHYR